MEFTGVKYDNLIGGTKIDAIIENVSIGGGEIERGALLAQTNGVYNPATGSDVDKPLVIAYGESSGSDVRIDSVYTRGYFNADGVVVGSDVDIEDFRNSLRRNGIYLTKEINGGISDD